MNIEAEYPVLTDMTDNPILLLFVVNNHKSIDYNLYVDVRACEVTMCECKLVRVHSEMKKNVRGKRLSRSTQKTYEEQFFHHVIFYI